MTRRAGSVGLTVACLAAMVAGAAWPFVIGVLAPILRQELGFSAGGLGVAYAGYYLVASLSSSRAGGFVDRRPVRWSAWVLIGLCLLQLLILATAGTWTQMLASGLVGGLCLGLANPVTNAAIAASLSPHQARFVVGVKQAGVPLAAAVTGAALPVVAVSAGWRAAVLATATLPAVALATSWVLRGGPSVAISERGGQRVGRLGLEVYALLLGVVAAGLNGYLALFVVDALDGSVQRAGVMMAAFATAGATGRILWSAVGGGHRTIPMLRGLGAVGGVALLGLVAPTAELVVWVLVVVCGLTAMAWQGLGMLAVMESGRVAVGEASGRVLRMFYGGFVVGSPVTGLAIDHLGFRWTWLGLALAALAGALSVRRRPPPSR